MTTDFILLPNAATPLSLRAQAAGADGRRRLAYDLEVQANGVRHDALIPVGAEVLGAGDIVGLDGAMVARVEPPRGAQGIEPNYMPFVEFVDADFPWRYSLSAFAAGKPRPWLALIALEAGEFEFIPQGQGPAPRIRVLDRVKSLPDLERNDWLHAHVHVATGAAPGGDLQALVDSRPDLCLSRLLCPRRLHENTGYYLFLVPSFEAGRLAGLGRTDPAGPGAAPAWTLAGDEPSIELPWYFQSQFATSAPEDFEQLVRRLKPLDINAASPIGRPARADASRPGYYDDPPPPGTGFAIQDALVQADAAPALYETPPALASQLAETLAQVIIGQSQTGAADSATAPDPLVAMPALGWTYRSKSLPDKAPKLDSSGAAPLSSVDPWYHRLNLDLAFRHAAGLGAETVRRNKEAFSARCWEQYAAIVEANRQIIRLQTAAELVAIIGEKHFARLPSDVSLGLAEPVQDFTPMSAGVTVADALRQTGVSRAYASRAMRSVANKVMVRSDAITAGDGQTRRMRDLPSPAIPGDGAPRDARGRARSILDLDVAELSALGVAADPPAAPTPAGEATPFQARIATLSARTSALKLAALDEATAERAAPSAEARRASTPAPGPGINSVLLVAHVVDFMLAAPKMKLQATITGLSVTEMTLAAPVLRAPSVDDALVEPFRQFAGESLLRSTSDLPSDTVAVVQENRPFIEAFLCGANTRMAQELQWRGFPIYAGGTIFAHFWKRLDGAADIRPIDQWHGPLGSHPMAAGGDKLVLLIRAPELLRRGKAIIGLNLGSGGKWNPSDSATELPVFSGMIGADVAYYGFETTHAQVMARLADYFFVIHEPPGRLRFGLDLPDDPATGAPHPRPVEHFPLTRLARQTINLRAVSAPHAQAGSGAASATATPGWDDLNWSDMTVDPASGYIDFAATHIGRISALPAYWDNNRTSASVARSFLQKPVAAVVPAKRVL